MTGQENYGQPPKPYEANVVRLHGKTGKFIYKDYLNRKEGEDVEETDIGDKVNVVFLKVRRKLAFYDSASERFVQTNEHNSHKDYVYLESMHDEGPAYEIRDRHPQLRTHQMVYAYMPERSEIVILPVKGASLGSRVEVEGVTKFYDYLSSFDERNFNDYITEITAVEEKGKMGEYFTMNFKEVKEINSKDEVLEMIKKIHEVTEVYDKYYSPTAPVLENAAEAASIESRIDYPEEDINPDDIPF
jgi:uncharacterized OB-fold protein